MKSVLSMVRGYLSKECCIIVNRVEGVLGKGWGVGVGREVRYPWGMCGGVGVGVGV